MQPQNEVGVTSKAKLWTGRVITVFTVAFLLFDTMVKVLNLPLAVEGTARLGYPVRLVMYIGIVELVCLGVYLYTRTAVLGAILLTGYLGGATATQGRVENAWFIFPVVVGVLVWAGLLLRNGQIRSPFPLQRSGIVVLSVLLLTVVATVVLPGSDSPSAKPRNPDLEYLKSVNSVAPLKDPELLFVLMTQFANSNLEAEGVDF